VDHCSVIQRSKTTPKDGIEAEVVILPQGLTEEEMKKHDIKGKFILTDDPDLTKLRLLAVNKLGAVGIIYDLVSELPPYRTRANFPTARRYTSFWYGKNGGESDALGFVLSATEGNDLRKLIENTEKKNKKLKEKGKEGNEKVVLRAKVDAKFYDGEMEVVDFFIPGKEKGQEVLAVAHLCHPKPGAVDNGSGCGTLIEVARTLEKLIAEGTLEQPKRGIRFLLMAEFTGTFCYLATNEKKIDQFVAGINLDMVGADQEVGGGRTLVLERTHNSNPSYVNDVLSALLNEVSKEVPNFLGSEGYATFKYANDQPFSGGSDHVVLGEPGVGIGTPMFIQWPDKYYHTGEDSIEKVCPKMLQLVGSMTAAYCYFIANAEKADILWMAQEVFTKGKERLSAYARKMVNDFSKKAQQKDYKHLSATLKRILPLFNFRRDIELQALDSIMKLNITNEEMLKEYLSELKKEITVFTENEIKLTTKAIEEIAKTLGVKKEKEEEKEKTELDLLGEKLIPIRIYRGMVTGLSLNDLTSEDAKEQQAINEEYLGMRVVLMSALFWIDGKRTISEIAELVKNDLGKTSVAYLVKMFKFYEKHKLLKLDEKK
jgi:aminopeptidase YwaD